MASIVRQIVSGPRARNPEAGLDLCYVTDFLIATSGPSSEFPRTLYRNPVENLVTFLDKKHGDQWQIFEFRAEGTSYPDEAVYNRIYHAPWPDHHPPPFGLIPNLMAAMRNWLQPGPTDSEHKRVAVIHCKAGKGRSGTVCCSYLISEEGWRREDALKRFTMRRMRAGFGEGVSIPSQVRWVRYVDRWTQEFRKQYIERAVEVVEVHIWGLRSGVKVSVEGFIDGGKKIKSHHTFVRSERSVMQPGSAGVSINESSEKQDSETLVSPNSTSAHSSKNDLSTADHEAIQDVVLRPAQPIRLQTSDINIDFERRNKSSYTGFAYLSSLAHVWFNAFFEGGYEGNDSGVFEIEWSAMDGIKGSARKGIKALDRLKVVWRYADQGHSIPEPKPNEPVIAPAPADWKGGDKDPEKNIETDQPGGVDSGRKGGTALTLKEMSDEAKSMLAGKRLGHRKSQPESVDISRASSIRDHGIDPHADRDPHDNVPSEDEGVQSHVPEVAGEVPDTRVVNETHDSERQDTAAGRLLETSIAKIGSFFNKS